MKRLIAKVIFVLIVWGILGFVQRTIIPLEMADASLLQLEDSDGAYAQWQGFKNLAQWFWVTYLLPLLVFVKDIKKLIKQGE